MKRELMFVAEDGKAFTNFNDCAKYEANMQFKNEINAMLRSLLTTRKFEQIIAEVKTTEQLRSALLNKLSEEMLKDIDAVREVINFREVK